MMMVDFIQWRDYDEYATWWTKRGLNAPSRILLPKTGLLVPGVAAGFVAFTDCPLAYLVFFAGNPEASKKDRSLAFDRIYNKLEGVVKNRGYLAILGNTQKNGMEELAARVGGRDLGKFTCFVKEL